MEANPEENLSMAADYLLRSSCRLSSTEDLLERFAELLFKIRDAGPHGDWFTVERDKYTIRLTVKIS